MNPIDLSHYRPTPDQRRFSISTFAVTGQVSWEAKPGGEFSARVEVLKGAFAKMIPFTAMEASVRVEKETGPKGKSDAGGTKKYSLKTIGAKSGSKLDNGTKEKTWTDLSVLSPIEIPWVAEYLLQRWSVGGPQETLFSFEDNQRVRDAILSFRDDPDADAGDAMAVLRVLKPGEKPASIANVDGTSARSKTKNYPEPRPGDVLVTFRDSKIAAFTVFVPIVGKLQFVAV